VADFTLSGEPEFEGSNPFDAAVFFAGSLVAAAELAGEVVSTAAFDGGVNVTIGAADQDGSGNELLDVAPAFPVGELTIAIFFAPEDPEITGVAEFGGALDWTDDSTGEVHAELGALPVTARTELEGSLTIQAEVSGTTIEATAEFDGFVATDDIFIGNADSPGNEFLDVTPTLTGEPDTDILQSPPYVHFDGTDDYLSAASDAALNGGAAFSVALVFDPEIVNAGATGTVLGKHDPSSTNHGWRVTWDATTGLVTASFASTLDGSNTRTRSNATAIRTRTAVVVTYDGTDINIYLTGIGLDNGAQSGTAGNMVANTSPFALGAHDVASGATNFFRGSVNGVWIWDLVLSGGEAATVDPYGQFDVPQAANLQVAWRPWDIHSTGFDEFFAAWIDDEGARPLTPPAIAAGKPLVLPSDPNEIMLFADRWDTDFLNVAELYGADSNLASNYPLSSDPNDASEDGKWRLFSPPTNQDEPEIVSGYRDFRNDLTIFVRIRNPTSFSNDIIVVQVLGLRLFYETATGNLFLFVGDAGTPERYQYGTNFDFGDGRVATFALRFNAATEQFSLHHNGVKVLPTGSSTTGAASSGTGLILCQSADYGVAFAVASCLPDLLIEQILNGFAGDVRLFEIVPQHWRLSPRRVPIPDLIWGGQLVPTGVNFPEEGGDPAPLVPFATEPARGTLELAAQPDDGDQFTVDDGEGNVVTFEFDDDASVSGGATSVTIGADVFDTVDNLIAAVNGSALNITAAVQSTFDQTGDGTPDAAYTVLTHGTVPADPLDRTTDVAIAIPVNGSGSLRATGMARPLQAVDRYEAIQRALFDVSEFEFTTESWWSFTDAPYIITEQTQDDDEGEGAAPFVNPLPTIVSVTATPEHLVTAIANAGPTDAGDVRSWWEVELETGNVETLVRIDEQDNNFSQNKDHTDTFQVPDGLNLEDKRIRFVIQSQVDPDQLWASLFFRMEGEEFNNGDTEVIIIPAPAQPEPPPQVDLTLSLEEQAFVVEEEAATRRALLRISNRSRYKLTRAFTNAKRDPRLPGRNLGGFEFGLLSVLTDFETAGSTFQVHRVRAQDIGFLDLLAVRFYGAGFEDFWWAIAYANAIIDPEEDMFVGQEIVIPPRDAVTTFLTRKPGATQGGG